MFVFYKMGEQRLGLRDKRGRCQLEKVESLPAREIHPRTGDESPSYKRSQTIYTAESEMLSDERLILGFEDVMESAPHVTDEIKLQFLTPTSIKAEGRWTSNLTFEHLIRNLLRRTRFLSICHCREDLDVDAHALIEAACSVTHTSRLQWLRKNRYSYRTEA